MRRSLLTAPDVVSAVAIVLLVGALVAGVNPTTTTTTGGSMEGVWSLGDQSHGDGDTSTPPVDDEGPVDGLQLEPPPPLTVAALRNAPVPSLCGHDPGTLIDGSLPGIPENEGHVTLADEPLYGTDSPPVVFGDVTGDGIDESLAVFWCSAGGVGHPHWFVLYGAGYDGPEILGSLDTGSVLGDSRGATKLIEFRRGGFSIGSVAVLPRDPACCPSGTATYHLRWDGSDLVADDVDVVDPLEYWPDRFPGVRFDLNPRDWRIADYSDRSSATDDLQLLHTASESGYSGLSVAQRDESSANEVIRAMEADFVEWEYEIPDGWYQDASVRGADRAVDVSWATPSGDSLVRTILVEFDEILLELSVSQYIEDTTVEWADLVDVLHSARIDRSEYYRAIGWEFEWD